MVWYLQNHQRPGLVAGLVLVPAVPVLVENKAVPELPLLVRMVAGNWPAAAAGKRRLGSVEPVLAVYPAAVLRLDFVAVPVVAAPVAGIPLHY